ncbi:MAG: hypothetical protein OEV33_03695, partial [Armatimonadota bacterium]|nr:hypothetical protein [Armatimonadota bacterium]
MTVKQKFAIVKRSGAGRAARFNARRGGTARRSAELTKRAGGTLEQQFSELVEHRDLLKRRLGGCRDEQVKRAVEDLLSGAEAGSPEALNALLTDAVIAWLRQRIGRPRARRRELGRLEELLRGKELTKREAMQI